MSLIAIVLAIFWIVSLIKIIAGSSSLGRSGTSFLSDSETEEKPKEKSVLLVTAHPDDESMFFVPVIRYLTAECGVKLHILCLSTGNVEGKGHLRKEEMLKACLVLKVPVSSVTILDHVELQDGFDKPWSHAFVAEIIHDAVAAHDINTIITFDKHGVSSHPQHCAVHYGVGNFLKETKRLSEGQQKSISGWELLTTNVMRKYSGPLDIWLSILYTLWLSKGTSYCVFNKRPYLCFVAMAQHDSQWIWYRKLFVILSSYSYINVLRKMSY